MTLDCSDTDRRADEGIGLGSVVGFRESLCVLLILGSIVGWAVWSSILGKSEGKVIPLQPRCIPEGG